VLLVLTDEHTKIAKEKGLLKLKDSAIRIKLEVAKLQRDIIKVVVILMKLLV
jgi:hypothetical protein